MLSYISTTWDQVQHLDVPTSERLSRCDRILGAACVKRRALKKLEPAERLPPAYVLELWLILLFARIIIIINFIYTIVTFSIKKATLATCIFRLSLPIDLYTTFCHSLSLSYMGIKEQSPRKPVEELYVALEDFAPAHPRDKLNAVALLFATQLWFDIMEYPNDLEETFATSPLSAF
ncbi:uncharacterized protein FOBCDRAFT_266478 [Fusarium oxysporum Fo47]|uniref:uncharacterized protein n=1 Tax=Fusarium oxysporum Fo47 TaxID=660027 RepID=UPI002869CF2D|nr:uncharacterized protein FOBCDRAFT_266478 [Fusarium oxysporum Fo47]QKD46595.2 hypothetical protein FOBCDRAFT_266478 [Fusarium oxysporum Fo47]